MDDNEFYYLILGAMGALFVCVVFLTVVRLVEDIRSLKPPKR